MSRPYPPPQENKLLLLYTFHTVGAMTNLQAIHFVIENGIMDYLDLQLTLAELTDVGFVQVLSVDDNRYYTLTTQGQETLVYFKKRIPASRRAWIDEIAERWREQFRKERMMTADYRKTAMGDYTVRLMAREAGKTLVDIRLSVASSRQAKLLCRTWEDRAADAYRALIDTLLVNNDDGFEEEESEQNEHSAEIK